MLAESELLQTVDVPVPARPLTPEQVQTAPHSTNARPYIIPAHVAA